MANVWLSKGSWTFPGVTCAAVLLASVTFFPGSAFAANCITDAELSAAIGDQVRAGHFAIDTSMLRDAPMCSGLTMARAIQRLVEQLKSQGRQAAGETDTSPRTASRDYDDANAQPDARDRRRAESIDGLLAFSAPSRCETGPAFTKLLSDLVLFPEEDAADQPQLGKVTVPPAYRSAVGAPQPERNEDGLTVRVPVSGEWHGLPVLGVEGHYWNGGDPGGFSIIMRASQQEARAMLNRAGFNMPASGSRTIPGDYEVTMSLEGQGNEATFTCL